MTYKKKIILGMEFWDGIPEGIIFHDPDSPTYQDLTEEEFNGFIKGLNIIDKHVHYSADSEEYNKYYKQFESLLPEGKKVLASWSGGMLVGFRELPDVFVREGL